MGGFGDESAVNVGAVVAGVALTLLLIGVGCCFGVYAYVEQEIMQLTKVYS